MNYRIFYEKHYKLKIPKNWEIHHIDADRKNNNINNLIMLPKKLHRALHKHIGLLSKKHLKILRRWYKNKGMYYGSYFLARELRDKVDTMNISLKTKKTNKIIVKKNRKDYLGYAKKYNIKTNKLIDSLYQDNGIKINFISDWMPKDNMIDYNSVLSNEEICNTYNELNKLL